MSFDLCEDLMKQQIVDRSACKLSFAPLCVYSVDSAMVEFGTFHLISKILIHENEIVLPAKYPAHILHNAA